MSAFFDTTEAHRKFHEALHPYDEQAADVAYNVLYLIERYKWAHQLITMIIDQEVEPPKGPLYDAWVEAFWVGEEESYTEVETYVERRARVVQLLGVLADTPGHQGLAAALRKTLLDHDAEVRHAG